MGIAFRSINRINMDANDSSSLSEDYDSFIRKIPDDQKKEAMFKSETMNKKHHSNMVQLNNMIMNFLHSNKYSETLKCLQKESASSKPIIAYENEDLDLKQSFIELEEANMLLKKMNIDKKVFQEREKELENFKNKFGKCNSTNENSESKTLQRERILPNSEYKVLNL